MYKLIIEGGNQVNGEVKISGSKNAVLPILFSSILADTPLRLTNVPKLTDVSTSLKILMDMGSNSTTEADGTICIDSSNLTNLNADYALVKTMRASILALGPMLTKYKKAKISLPGGCAIGARPVDIHLKAFEKMGAKIEIKNGYINASTKGLSGCAINFDLASVTATENILMAATLAKGKTIIHNAAQEPEIADLIYCLRKMGAKISGENTSTIIIQGVKNLTGVKYKISSDRIEAATYLVAAAITKGRITVKDVHIDAMRAVIGKLIEIGADIKTKANSITLDMRDRTPKAVNIRTSPYPNFPTDMQAQFVALNSIAKGDSIITETVFENRFMHVPELCRMGANLKLEGNTVLCKGVKSLYGTNLMATDLRASASLVLAGIVAKGTTSIERIYHLDRGYESIEEKFKLLGIKINRIQY